VEPTPLIALAGNPNSGKTTLFNSLTGLNFKVANYPGVTVERKEAEIEFPDSSKARIVDLPGIYSLSGLSIDERIATTEILQGIESERPALIIHVCDSTNLERNFFLLTQLIDCGVKVVLALTMGDLAKKSGLAIHKELLSRALGVPVVEVSGREKKGLGELLRVVQLELANETPRKGYLWGSNSQTYLAVVDELGQSITKGREEFNGLSKRTIGSLYIQDIWPDTTAETSELVKASQDKLRANGIDPQSYETSERYRFISEIVRNSTSVSSPESKNWTHKIDRFVTHPIFGTGTFLVVMAALFQAIFSLAEYPMNLLESLVSGLGEFVTLRLPESQFRSLLVDGIISGVGSVIVFTPQIGILVLLLALLEDSGYLSRAALVMDRVLRPIGLQGRSFIPLLSSFACAIPGILSTRTIPTFGDRIATIMIAPLMSCSARLPVYTVLIGAFVPETTYLGIFSLKGLALLGMYLLGIMGAAAVSAILRRTALRGSPALFVMEMPPYRTPIARNVLRQLYTAILSFIRSAGTIILAVTVLLWFLASYPKDRATLRESYAGKIGMLIEPAIMPLGYNWEIGVSIIASFAAREVFISSLSTVYNLETTGDDPRDLISLLKEKKNKGEFTNGSAASLLVFYVFACMCTSTLAVCKRETNSWGWTAFMFFYMTGIAYFAALGTYQVWRIL